MILWDIVPPLPPPVKQDATYTKQVYRHIKHCVGVGSCFTGGGGGGTMLQRQKTERVAI